MLGIGQLELIPGGLNTASDVSLRWDIPSVQQIMDVLQGRYEDKVVAGTFDDLTPEEEQFELQKLQIQIAFKTVGYLGELGPQPDEFIEAAMAEARGYYPSPRDELIAQEEVRIA